MDRHILRTHIGRRGASLSAERLLTQTNIDPILASLLEATDAVARDAALEVVVVRHAQPIVGAILRRFRGGGALRPDDLDDVSSTVTLRLVRRLQEFAEGGEAIGSLRDFTATLTYNAAYDVLRRRFPERTRLKNRIRYTLTRDRRFALWTAGDSILGGLRAWSGRDDPPAAVELASDVPSAFRNDLPGALAAIFARIGGPATVEELLDVIARGWGINESPPIELADAPDPVADLPFLRFETRQYLGRLWQEVCTLVPRQRAALLLNLRAPDTVNAVALLVLVGVATIDEIADAIGIATERLAEIWNELPLDDLAIGSMLGLDRQRVINLRKSARERLTRRMNSTARPQRR